MGDDVFRGDETVEEVNPGPFKTYCLRPVVIEAIWVPNDDRPQDGFYGVFFAGHSIQMLKEDFDALFKAMP